MDRTGTEQGLVRMVHGPSRRCLDADPDGALPLKQDPIDEGMAENREVRPVAGRLQVGIIRGHAGVRSTMHGPRGYPGTLRCIMIVGPGIAKIQGSGAERLLHGAPLLDGRTINGNGATAPMIRGLAEVALIFQADKRGQYLGTGPAGASQCRPAIKVLGETANGNLGVDGGAPPHATASEVQSRRLDGRAAGEQSRPMIPFVRKQRKVIRALDFWWRVGGT